MQFPPSFFEDEVRDGFFVSGKMKRFWAAQLEVLDQIDQICRRHGLTYHAECGTLLGAIRHGGFIPWDDDLDISMKRDQLDLFTKYALEELPEDYHLWDVDHEPEFDNILTRIVHFKVIDFGSNMLLNNQGCPYAVGVDIFPLDNMAPTKEADEEQLQLIKYALGLSDLLKSGERVSTEQKTVLENILRQNHIHIPRSYPFHQRLHIAAKELMTIFNDQPSKEVTIMGNHLENPNYRFPSDAYDKVIYVPFDGFQMPVPAQYDLIMKREYGDYMRPVRGYSAHDYPGFCKHDEAMREVLGGIWCEYLFDEKALEEIPRKQRVDDLATAREILSMLLQAEGAVEQLVSQGIVEQLPELLEQCQKLAVQLGEQLEQAEKAQSAYYEATGKDLKVQLLIGKLEHFCELIYHLYQFLLGEEEECPSFEDLRFCLTDADGILNQDLAVQSRNVFLVSRPKYWEKILPLIQSRMDAGVEVLLMPVPWYEKNLMGELGTLHFEGDTFAELVKGLSIPVLSYNQVPLSQLLPEELYTQDYAGNCASGTSLHPYFYTERLREYTQKLIYVCPLQMDEIPVGDDRGFSTLKYCADMPGVVWADQALVQSPEMKDAYVRALVAYAGEEHRDYWERHIDGVILPKASEEYPLRQEDIQIPDLWQAFIAGGQSGRKKCLCFHMGCSVFLQDKDRSVQKLREVLDIFATNRDKIMVHWWMDKGFFESIQEESSLKEEIQALQQLFTDRGLGIIDDAPDRATVVGLCDAYYGDGSFVMNLFAREKKPVMQMNVDV